MGTSPPPEFGAGGMGLSLRFCHVAKFYAPALLALQCRKMCFLPLQQNFYTKSRHASPRIPVRSTPMITINNFSLEVEVYGVRLTGTAMETEVIAALSSYGLRKVLRYFGTKYCCPYNVGGSEKKPVVTWKRLVS